MRWALSFAVQVAGFQGVARPFIGPHPHLHASHIWCDRHSALPMLDHGAAVAAHLSYDLIAHFRDTFKSTASTATTHAHTARCPVKLMRHGVDDIALLRSSSHATNQGLSALAGAWEEEELGQFMKCALTASLWL